jgi:putative redox protein
MGTVTVQWIGREAFVGIDSSKHSVVMSSQDQDNGIGCKPSELLLIALGGCTGVDLVNILKKQRQQIRSVEMHISGEHAPTPPWAYRSIHIIATIRGKSLSAKAVETALDLAVTKYCSVGATIAGTATITHSYELLEEED